MADFGHYTTRVNLFRGQFGGLPAWARWIFLLVTLPGMALVALSIVAVVVSIAALLFLAVPTYALLRAMVGGGESWIQPVEQVGPTRRIDSIVRDADSAAPDEVDGE